MKRPRKRAEMLLAAESLVAGLALFELGVRWLEPQPAVRYQWSPVTFYTPIPDTRFVYRRREFAVPVEYNAHGMRDRPRALAKPPGGLRVALVGDSQTESKEVPFDSTWGQHLERSLAAALPGAHVEVLNFGVSGFGTVASLARFESLGCSFAPDVVVYLFSHNDPDDNLTASDRRLWTLESGRLELRRLPERGPERLARAVLDPIKQHLQAYSFLKFRLAQLGRGGAPAAAPHGEETAPPGEAAVLPGGAAGAGGTAGIDSAAGAASAAAGAQAARAWEVFGAALARLDRSVRECGGELVVAQAGSLGADMTQRLGDACRGLGIALVDLQPALGAAGAATNYRWDGHWRPLGHRVAAAVLAPEIAAHLRRE